MFTDSHQPDYQIPIMLSLDNQPTACTITRTRHIIRDASSARRISRGIAARNISEHRKVILFLAANPLCNTRLAFDEECAAIERELRMTEGRDEFDFRSKWAVTADEMMRHLNELRPTVIHFSGHGSGSGTRSKRRAGFRDIGDAGSRLDNRLYLQDEHGNPQCVTSRALKLMVEAAAASARVVVLNACYSGQQSNALRTVVDCVVGMTGAIHDDSARSFAVGFYRALGNRRSIGNAVDQAIAILAAKQLPSECLPRCRTRNGINAGQIFLTERSRAPHSEPSRIRARHASLSPRAPVSGPTR